MGKLLLFLALGSLALGGFACGDDDGDAPTATSRPAIPPTEEPTPDPDGTVDPLNPGSTEPKYSKSTLASGDFVFLVDVRFSVHSESGGWERVVFEFLGPGLPAATARYSDSYVECGSGRVNTPAEGERLLLVEFRPAAAHDDEGQVTLKSGQTSATAAPGGSIVGGSQACDFEGVVEWAVAISGELANFKMMTLEGPLRVVIDIKR